MLSQSVLLSALMASAAFAYPHIPGYTARAVQADEECEAEPTPGPYAAALEFFDNQDCSGDRLQKVCYYSIQETVDGGAGFYSCGSGALPDNSPSYAKVIDSPFPEIEILFTRDQSCPPNGAGAVFVSLGNNKNCVLFSKGGDTPGVSIYPHGGSGLVKREEKRDGAKCNGFNVESQDNTYSASVQVSEIIDCTNGAEAGCTIGEENSYTESVSTSFSTSAGGGIEGIFSVEATFGTEYTSEESTTFQRGFSIPAGQKGYLSAYSGATRFRGKFTGCDSGDSEQPGEVLAIKAGTFSYSIIITNTRAFNNATTV
jgi:hypothetical protein